MRPLWLVFKLHLHILGPERQAEQEALSIGTTECFEL